MEYAEVLKVIVVIVLGGFAFYFQTSAKAKSKIAEIQEVISDITAKAIIFIKEAEEDYKDTTNSGGKKFTQVVTKLHDLIPTPLQAIITEEMIKNIVQNTFDQIEAYAKTQLDKAVDNIKTDTKKKLKTK